MNDKMVILNAHMEITELKKALQVATSWTKDDKPIPEDEAIWKAHPLMDGANKTYLEALRMIGAKRSKYALVDLVNWLLLEIEKHKDRVDNLENLIREATCLASRCDGSEARDIVFKLAVIMERAKVHD